jgi:hypothetical protein
VVDAVNVAVLEPVVTVTLAGTVTAALLEDSVTTCPPVAARPVNVTVQVVLCAGARLPDAQLRPDNWVLGATLRLNVLEVPFAVAVTVDVCAVVTAVDDAVNVAVLEPALTVTLAGTVMAALLEESVTACPPAGATPVSVTVQVDDDEGPMVPGEHVKLLRLTTVGCEMVMVPPEPAPGMLVPVGSAA